MVRCLLSFSKRWRSKNSFCSNDNAITKGNPSVRRLSERFRWRVCSPCRKSKRLMKSLIWQHFPGMRSIAEMAYLTSEARAKLDAFKAVTVKHARLQEIDDQMSLLVEE